MTAHTGSSAAFEREPRRHRAATARDRSGPEEGSSDQHEPGRTTTHPLLRLQSQAGNAAVARLLQRMPDPAVQREGGMEEEEEDLAQASHDTALQRQAEGDEEEEDLAMADHDEGAEDGVVGLKGGELAAGTAGLIDSLRGAGSGLSENVRAAAEPALGVNLAPVRVHQDAASDSLARSMTARAFTTGQDIFLRNDANPNDSRLMAHELTHVVQQSEGVAGAAGGQRMTVGAADDPLEAQADQVAADIASGAPANREIEDQ